MTSMGEWKTIDTDMDQGLVQVITHDQQPRLVFSADQKQFLTQGWFWEFGEMNAAATELHVQGRFMTRSPISFF
jgi:hypothetical protein